MRREELIEQFARECLYFKENRPCLPHQKTGAQCRCSAYAPRHEKIFISLFSSETAVIRSAALVQRLKSDSPNCYITYLTPYPELLSSLVDEKIKLTDNAAEPLKMDHFDYAINLDMDKRAGALMNLLNADIRKGFYLRNGHILPLDDSASAIYLKQMLPKTAGKENQAMDPIQELFQICGFEYRRETPQLTPEKPTFALPNWETPVIGLTVNSDELKSYVGKWSVGHWVRLVELIRNRGLVPLLLGQSDQDAFFRDLVQKCSAEYLGPLGLADLAAVTSQCDVVAGLTGYILELGWAMGSDVVALKHVTDQAVTKSYFRGRGDVIEAQTFDGKPGLLDDILPDQVLEAIEHRLTKRESRHTIKQSIQEVNQEKQTNTSRSKHQ